MFETEMSGALGSGEGVMNSVGPPDDCSNVMTSAPLEQQKQWWPVQQEGAPSESSAARMAAEVADAGSSSGLQKPRAATSAVSHSTSSKIPARPRRETAIRDDCTTVEGARQSHLTTASSALSDARPPPRAARRTTSILVMKIADEIPPGESWVTKTLRPFLKRFPPPELDLSLRFGM